jgi:hypothetical protein
MISIISKKRFDDVSPKNLDGSFDYEYRGFIYLIAVGAHDFYVRVYDNEPNATVLSPTNARTFPEAQALVAFIISSLNYTSIKFYNGAVGSYCLVDIQTLGFLS